MLLLRQRFFCLNQLLVLKVISLFLLGELAYLLVHFLLFSFEHPELGLECGLVLPLRLLDLLLDLDELSHKDVSLGLMLVDLGLDATADLLEAVQTHRVLNLNMGVALVVCEAARIYKVPNLEVFFRLEG